MKKLTVTVGVPAYNEEANIERLLTSICAQKEDSFIIKKILVVSDCSTDETVSRVKRVKDKRIKLIRNQSRQGQAYCQNKIFSLGNTDVMVLFEADTCPATANFLNELLQPFLRDNEIGLVQGLPLPLSPRTFIEKVLCSQVQAYQRFISSGDTSPSQGGRAFSRKVYLKLHWFGAIPEDKYALLWCWHKRIKITLQKTAVCWYRCPQHFSDYVIKQEKTHSGLLALQSRFPKLVIDYPTKKPIYIRLKMATYFFIKSPLSFLSYLMFKMILSQKRRLVSFSNFLPVAQTTKNLAEGI